MVAVARERTVTMKVSAYRRLLPSRVNWAMVLLTQCILLMLLTRPS